MPRRDLLLLLLAFVLSVAVRWPHVDRPLSMHHEYCTATALIILQNWYTDGFMAHHGVPAITFTGPADRYPEGWLDAPAVRDGVIHYLSHPPLAYDLPYLLFSITGTAPSAWGLQLLNILFHLVAAVALYLAVRVVVQGWAPLFAALLYLFMPATLWFHGNAYMSDMFVQNFWMLHIAVAMHLFTIPRMPGRRLLFLFGFTLFLAVYTSWLGVFAGVVSFWISAWRARKWPGMYAAMLIAILAVGAALLLTAVRYLSLIDAQELWDYYLTRWAVRGSANIIPEAGTYLGQLAMNYRTGFLPVIALLVVLAGWHLLRRERPWPGGPAAMLLIALAALPVLLDHLFLLRYAHHDFAALKGGVLLCAMAGIMLGRLPIKGAWVTVVLTLALGAGYFHRINPMDLSEASYSRQRDLGLTMRDEVAPQETVLCLGFTPDPQMLWYAERTLFRIDSLEEGRAFLRAQGTAVGVVFEWDAEGARHTRISAFDGTP